MLLALMLCIPLALPAADPVLEPLPDTSAPPTGLSEADELEPEVTIIKRDKETIHEYRVNGQLYMVKIEPRNGPPYYLIDKDGDGSLESRYNKLEPALLVPSWMIFRW
ncbi:MAG: DUF2782 domain-containing protein [Gammaproteobacteria bacterium]|nr:DUF2782 domain-containing protein [Gammaproteobacteria bacterium]MDH3559433.1 DUF2782 domain-containing protein [Gammaproteobacteria bacterium]